MKAMILAAGLGTRLRPLTDDRPKALVTVAGRPMLYWVIARLVRHGFTEIIINAHHFAEQIEAFADAFGHPGVSLTVSVEEEILDTGGGVRKAAWFFDDEPFLVHNVDVLTDLDLSGLMNAHRSTDALVTVAVKKRKSSRHLLFDQEDILCGWRSDVTGETRMVRGARSARPISDTGSPGLSRSPHGEVTPLPFMGVYVMSPAVLSRLTGPGPFSIIDFFLDLANSGGQIQAYRAEEARWADLGSVDRIAAAERLFGTDWFADFG